MKWKNIGGGSYQISPNRIIKAGETFEADPEQIPPIFRDTIIPLNPDDLPKPFTRTKASKALAEIEPDPKSFSIQKRNAGWYDVVDQGGNFMNENALRIGEAEELIQKLESGGV
jgi:hypothetical protein